MMSPLFLEKTRHRLFILFYVISSPSVAIIAWNIPRYSLISRGFTSSPQAEAMVIKKGFTTVQLEKCLSEYQTLGVLHVDKEKTQIIFEQLGDEGGE